MADWVRSFTYDPIKPLLESSSAAVRILCRYDLLESRHDDIERLWALPEVCRILNAQSPAGSWRSKSKNAQRYPAVDYNLLETWKQLRFLVQQYRLNRTDRRIAAAAEFVLSRQTDDGDIRGILANQLTMYYTGALLYLLVRAGYADDPRVARAFEWLLSSRQDDGGWLPGPLLGDNFSGLEVNSLSTGAGETIRQWDRSKPFCLNGTGMVLRGFAAHSDYRRTEAAQKAARLLKKSFFGRNNYNSYRHPDHWLVFHYPYWWNDLVSATDTITPILPDAGNDRDICRAVDWLLAHQEPDGLWRVHYSRLHKRLDSPKAREQRFWVSLNICRVLKPILDGCQPDWCHPEHF